MTGAPAPVSNRQLRDVHILLSPDAEEALAEQRAAASGADSPA